MVQSATIMNAKLALEKYAQELDPLLAKFFRTAEVEARKISPDSVVATKHLGEFTRRKAKRIRAALLFYSYLMLGGQDVAQGRWASLFVEIIHAYLLVHDDIMDQDSTRRGKPTMHKIYEQDYLRRYPKSKGGLHFGESVAINIGDIACHLALELLAKTDFPIEYKLRAITRAHRQLVLTGHGQMLDVLTTAKPNVTEAEVYHILEAKTAVYTYETPITVGALLAGASDQDVKDLSKFAIPAGIAFQIQDDILGMFGDEEKLGKPNTSDLREGKQTLLIIEALKHGNRKQTKLIEQALGNPDLAEAMANDVRQVIIETGSLEHSKQVARKFVSKAKRALAKRPDWQGEGREFLDGIADYMIEREF